MSEFPKDITLKKGFHYGERKLRITLMPFENKGLPPDREFERFEGEIAIATLFKGMNMPKPRLPFSTEKAFAKELHAFLEKEIKQAKGIYGDMMVHYGGGLTGLVTINCTRMVSADYLEQNAQVVVGILEKNRDKILDMYNAACRDDEKFKRAQDVAKKAMEMNPLVRQAAGGNIDALAQHIYECEELEDKAADHFQAAVMFMTVGRGKTVPEAPDTSPKPRINDKGQIELDIADVPSVIAPGHDLKVLRSADMNAAGEIVVPPEDMRAADPADGKGHGVWLQHVDPSIIDRLKMFRHRFGSDESGALRGNESDAPEPSPALERKSARETHPNNNAAAQAIAAASMEFAMAEIKRGRGSASR